MSCIICSSSAEKRKFTYHSTDYYQCEVCGLIRALPFPSNKGLKEHYEKRFKNGNYTVINTNIGMYRGIYEKYIGLIRKSEGSLENKRVLDVGCFTGDFLNLAQKNGAITYGIELQESAARTAEKSHPGRIQNCSFTEASFPHTFDIITAFGVIEHL